ncbi:hypothetical protein DPMN_094533 [Dreissena polymorpha]|uniref:Uncharacterized protein n=1 Tax=Dreissena polymorpha TaxID=45954 RepID=A0A9D4L5W9_DREPO|nr:hypothetical protein DPMN_094533 [Dreissena polymorpha]
MFGHVFSATKTIFELIQYIIGKNLMTKFLEDRKVIVASRVKNAPPLESHTNLLTKFHEDWTKKSIYSHIRKNAPPPGGHVFKATKTIFELIQDIIGTNLLTKFHDDRKINVTSRVLTRKNAPPLWWPYILGMKNAPPLGSHVFQANVTIFELIQDINKTNLLTKFHEDWTINVASRVNKTIVKQYKSPTGSTICDRLTDAQSENYKSPPVKPPLGGHVFQPTGIIFELVQDIIGMNLLTKFHEDWTINVASRVKNAPPLGSHVFQAKVTIFEHLQDIIGTNLLSKFHGDWKINVAYRVLTRKYRENCSAPWRPYINETNVLTKFHDDWAKIVTSRMFIRFLYSHIMNTSTPLGGHVFQRTGTIF